MSRFRINSKHDTNFKETLQNEMKVNGNNSVGS